MRRGAAFINDANVDAITSVGEGFRIDWTDASSENAGNAAEVERATLRRTRIIICAGVASRHFAAMLGDRVNIYPVKGYSITVQLESPQSQEAAPHVSLLDEAAKIVTSRLGADRFRVAGTPNSTASTATFAPIGCGL